MATILDYRGQPVSTKDLTIEHAAPKITGVRSVWRDSVNFGLTPSRLVDLLTKSAQGDLHDYMTLAEEMEERDLHYRSVLTTRKLTAAGLTVSVDAKTDKSEDVKLADEVREQIVEDPTFEDMLFDALDAIGKGYSVVEIQWDRSERQWRPKCYDWADPHFFRFDDDTGRQIRLYDEKDPGFGIELPAYKFITHVAKMKSGLPLRGGLARLAAVAFMCKSYALKDWMAFAEVFGMPLRLGKYGSQATEEDIGKLATAVANLGSDAAAVMPDTMQVEMVEAARGAGGDKLFATLADWLDRQVSKGVLGQTMTTDDGSSLSQAKVHNDVRIDLLRADARQLTNTLNRDLVIPYVVLNHGMRPRNQYPRLRISYEEPEDLKTLTEAAIPWIDRGMTVEVSVMRDKFGLPEPAAGADVIGPIVKPQDKGDDASNEDEKEEERAKNRAALELNQTDNGDEIDGLIDSFRDEWERVTDPAFDPLKAAVNEAKDYDDMLARIDALADKMDTTEFVKHIATQMFKTRGLGDATDSV